MLLPKSIAVCEVGLRDGLQGEKKVLSIEQKITLLTRIQDAGIRCIEIGSFVSPKAVPAMADTDTVYRQLSKRPGVDYRALVVNKKGLDRAIDCGVNKVKITLSASETHQRANAGSTPAQMFEQFSLMAASAALNGVTLSGAIATAFGCPFEGEVPISRVIYTVDEFRKIGVNELSLSDTTGMANPVKVYKTCTELLHAYPDVLWNLHFHNTRGMGLANVLAAMQAGITRFDSSLGGLGGCPFAPGATGNIATEDLLHMCSEMGIETGVDLDAIIGSARLLQEYMERELPGAVLKAGKVSDLYQVASC